MRLSHRALTIGLVAALMFLGLLFRGYHFSDWLHFELDQSRDARVIDHALNEGPGSLPLLGPKAGGTFLRLAPGFYYLEYFGALLFGKTAPGQAMIVMILSVAAIPFFFFLVRRYFSLPVSSLLALLFTISVYFVLYGRFAWNPNIVPFFIIAGMYALLRAVDYEERSPGRWFCIATFFLALATHGHFLAFVTLPIIVVIFLFIKRPHFRIRVWVVALLIIATLYLPMALNEYATGGKNTQEFFGAITDKADKEDHILVDKLLRNSAEHALGALVITTGFEGGTFPTMSLSSGKFWFSCTEKCDQGKWYGIAAALILIAAVITLLTSWWRETEPRRKDFLRLMIVWLGVTFFVYTPLSYGFAPRFFLVSGPVFLILLGIVLTALGKMLKQKILAESIVALILGVFVVMNGYFLFGRFHQLAQAEKVALDTPPDRILKEIVRVTYAQENHIADFIEARYQTNHYPVYMYSAPQYRRAFKYLLERRGIENAVLGYDGIYREGTYFLIQRSQSNLGRILEKYREHYDIGSENFFGTLTVIELIPKEETILGEREDLNAPRPADTITAPPRYTWREFYEYLTGQTPQADDDQSTSEQLDNQEDQSQDSLGDTNDQSDN